MNKILQHKTKASALYYALFVVILTSFLLLGILRLFDLRFQLLIAEQKRIRLEDRVNGLALLHRANPNMLKGVWSDSLSLFKDENLPVFWEKRYRGPYLVVNYEAKDPKASFSKTLFLGAQPTETALILQEQNHPLVFCGYSQISGDAFIGGNGIRRGKIYGQSFQGKTPIKGTVNYRNGTLPIFDNDFLIHIESLQKRTHENSSPTFNPLSSQTNVPFCEDPLFIKEDNIEPNQILKGNITLWAADSLIIGSDQILEEVELVAKHVYIKNGFKGNIHVLASGSITMEENCQLKYPSSLTLFNKEKEGQITIPQTSSVNGAIFYWGPEEPSKGSVAILLKGSVTGLVWCNQNIHLEGTIRGSCFTRQFIFRDNRHYYPNYLKDGKVNRKMLPENFLYPSCFKTEWTYDILDQKKSTSLISE